MATLPANTSRPIPTIGFIAHLDTSPDYSGTDVKPRLVAHYDGGQILLNPQEKVVLSPEQFPELKDYAGQTLITTDGTTLLGADDKAGIAEIMAAIEYLVAHPEIVHGVVKVGFTPDEDPPLALTCSMSRSLLPALLSPWTAGQWAGWNMKTSTLPAQQ